MIQHLTRPVSPFAAENQAIIKDVKNHSANGIFVLNNKVVRYTAKAENKPAPAEEKF